jgi:ferredoxin
MPWVSETMCAGCGLCVDYCPVQAVRQNSSDGKAIIDDTKCIRCGKCHDICPRNAVRHDSEKIPYLVEENIIRTKALIKHYDSVESQGAFLERMIKHFNMQKKVAVLTIDKLNALKRSGK